MGVNRMPRKIRSHPPKVCPESPVWSSWTTMDQHKQKTSNHGSSKPNNLRIKTILFKRVEASKTAGKDGLQICQHEASLQTYAIIILPSQHIYKKWDTYIQKSVQNNLMDPIRCSFFSIQQHQVPPHQVRGPRALIAMLPSPSHGAFPKNTLHLHGLMSFGCLHVPLEAFMYLWGLWDLSCTFHHFQHLPPSSPIFIAHEPKSACWTHRTGTTEVGPKK